VTKFELADDKRTSGKNNDDAGVVVIKIFLAYSGHRPVAGNITRSIRLKDARVSDVHRSLIESLTGETEKELL